MASTSSSNRILKRANPSTIQDKFLVGYQGWFTCGGDGEPVGPGHHGWLHWFNFPIPDGGRPNTDVWPDVSSYSPSELFPAPGLKTQSGDPVFLFSSRNAKTVQRHFHWMAEHGVDGAFLQRFAGQCDLEAGNEGVMRIRDEVGDRVREAAEREGRVFAIMYDVSGVAPDRIQRILERDWAHLIRHKGILDSPNYLKERGKAVVALWGFGFDNAKHTPELVHSITEFFRNTTPGGVYIMAGTPASWRTAEGDADRNPAFLDVWMNDFDAISPWTVGRYRTEQDADSFFEDKMKGDFELIKYHNEQGSARKIDYIPVVLPGGSGYNLSEAKWGFNDIKRNGGRFLWKQISNAKRLGVRTIYGAMWDEYDEGTAFMPIVEHKRNLPVSDKFRFMALDEDGYDLPSDWYMRICGFAAEGLRSERLIHETFPVKELQDYWSSRPKYEEVNDKSGDFVSGSSSKGGAGSSSEAGTGPGQTYEEWLASQKDEKEEAPPPPYTLEADEPASSTAIAPATIPSHTASQTSPTAGTISSPIANAGVHASSHSSRPGLSSPSNLQQAQDPISGLVSDFGRQSISNNTAPPSGNIHPHAVSGRRPSGPAPPVHPAHPAAQGPNQIASSGYQWNAPPSGPPRPPSRPSSRPSSQSRPGVTQESLPHSQHAPHSPHAFASSPATNRPTSGSLSQGQWPPPEWKLPSNQSTTSSVPYATYSGSTSGGANLGRPHTFSASAGKPTSGSSLRPSSTVTGRPSSAASKPITPPPSGSHTPINSQHPIPSYPPAPSANSPPNKFGTAPYPPRPVQSYAVGSSSTVPSSHTHGQGQPTFQFPAAPSTSPYSPTVSTYPGQAGPNFPGQVSGSSYQPMPGSSDYSPWSGGSPHISPPHSPPAIAASTYPGPSPHPSRPYSPGQGSMPQHQYSGPAFPSTDVASSVGRPDVTGGGFYFPGPQGPSGGYEEGYFSGGIDTNVNMNMPSGGSAAYGSSYSGQYGMSASSYPGGPSYPQPSGTGAGAPWMGPPPPRPPAQSGSSYGKPNFPVASPAGSSSSGALGSALNAVDKLAGKKTREQLESLAQCKFFLSKITFQLRF
ncbi:hypothetical protein CVT26_003643 [Gymnopilus dilepis]|uniref:Xylosidase/arabinosidase n=1 Tax=Gymnopilus dilepis TaxID=231916 RepID=A0A409VSJ4_9AGAR|nr:hypothetical protein CVT26_003643 [Gymnopilus dilepis]